MGGMTYKGITGEESPTVTEGTYVNIEPSEELWWKSIPIVTDPLMEHNTIMLATPGHYGLVQKVTPEFIKMALESLEADHRVWARPGKTSLAIYISAKSSVKEDLIDKDVWDTILTSKMYTSGYCHKVDGIMVRLYFLAQGESVFDLVKHISEPVTNLEGYTVTPPSELDPYEIPF